MTAGGAAPTLPTVALLGGTGAQGRGLAFRFARAGIPVRVGSRDPARARASAAELTELLRRAEPASSASVLGGENAAVAATAPVVVLAVPYAGHAELIRGLRGELAGKTVISCVNPVGFDASGAFAIQPGAGSAAEEAAQLAPEARVVAAYHHLSAPKLLRPEADVSGDDVLLCGDDEDALLLVDELTRRGLGARPVRAGALRLAGTLEALTAVIISVNRRYRVSAGVALTGFPRPDPAEAEHAAPPS